VVFFFHKVDARAIFVSPLPLPPGFQHELVVRVDLLGLNLSACDNEYLLGVFLLFFRTFYLVFFVAAPLWLLGGGSSVFSAGLADFCFYSTITM